MNKTITICVCHRISFEEIWSYAQKNKLDFEDLIAEEKCCCGCKMCRPYIKKMMLTGETAFAPGDFLISERS